MENTILTFGDARKMIVDTIIDLKSGKMEVSRGMAIAANMKVLNDNIQAEINAAKLSMIAEKNGKDFGGVLKLGKRILCDNNTPMIEMQ
jgi:hypothetical protein